LITDPHVPNHEYTTGRASITSPGGQIKYVIATSVGGLVALDALKVEMIPEPSTIALMIVGLGGAALHRRRRAV
jgi:hypothetical protein